MKSIIRKCIEFGKKNGDQYANEEDHGVKLRLRGKGSGYKEGPEKQGKTNIFRANFSYFFSTSFWVSYISLSLSF